MGESDELTMCKVASTEVEKDCTQELCMMNDFVLKYGV